MKWNEQLKGYFERLGRANEDYLTPFVSVSASVMKVGV